MVEAKVLAAMAARWFDAAGFNIAFSCLPSDIAREGASASAGLLAAAVELRDLLAQSQQGRQALRDLGFEPAPQPSPATQQVRWTDADAALASATLKALGAQKAVAWARPVFATEAVEPFDKGDLVDVEFYNHPERPEGEGWRPLVFADTDDARAARKQGANHD